METPIKVLHLVRKPVIGGAEMLVKNIINANDDKNIEHFVFCTNNGPLLKLIDPNKKTRVLIKKSSNHFMFTLNLRMIVQKHKICIIHTHQTIDSFFAAVASLGYSIKIIRSFHGYDGVYNNGIISKKNKLLYFLSRNKVAFNLFVSNSLLQYYQIRIPDLLPVKKTGVLYNGVNMENLQKSTKSNIRKELNLNPNSLLLGMVGSFTTQGRDQLTVCKAMAYVLKVKPDIHFSFVGKQKSDGYSSFATCYNYCLENGLTKNIHFAGERSDIGSLLNNLDIYIHSSNNDTFGIALAEAMIMKVPCIASDIPPFHELSDNGKLVRLFKKGDAEELSKIIIEELNSLEDRETKNRVLKAYEHAIKNFSIKQHIKALHNYYEDV